MFCVVLATLFTALIANLSADSADFHCPFTTETHQLRCCITDSSTFHIQLNAFSHHFNLWLLGAGRRTMVTNSGTTKTGLNALLVFMISFHNNRFGCYAKGRLGKEIRTRKTGIGRMAVPWLFRIGCFLRPPTFDLRPLQETFLFLLLLIHIITPVTGKLAPNRQTINPITLDGIP